MLKINRNSAILVAMLVFLGCAYFGNTLNAIGFFILIVVASLALSFKFTFNRFSATSFAFFLLVLISYYWSARNTSVWVSTLFIFERTFAAFFLVLIMCSYFKTYGNRIDTKMYINIYIISTLILLVYVIINTSMSSFYAFNAYRLGDDIGLNANEIGIVISTSALYCFHSWYKNRESKIYFVFFIIMTAVTFFTGSRKALLIVLIGVPLYKFVVDGNRKMIRNLVFVCFFLFFAYWLIMNNSVLYNTVGYRIEILIRQIFFHSELVDSSILTREYFRDLSMQMFKEKPILGWGVNGFLSYSQMINRNIASYSHNNYTELLVNYGIIGFLLYYIPRLSLIIRWIRSKEYKSNNTASLLFIMMILCFFIDYGMVSYTSIPIQFVYALAVFEYQRIKTNNNKNNVLQL